MPARIPSQARLRSKPKARAAVPGLRALRRHPAANASPSGDERVAPVRSPRTLLPASAVPATTCSAPFASACRPVDGVPPATTAGSYARG